MVTMIDELRMVGRRSAAGVSQAGSCLAVFGEIDASNADAIAEQMWQAAEGRSSVIVDLRALSFLDCTGARALARLHRRRQEAGDTTDIVVAAGSVVARLLTLTGLAAVLDLQVSLPRVDPARRCA